MKIRTVAAAVAVGTLAAAGMVVPAEAAISTPIQTCVFRQVHTWWPGKDYVTLSGRGSIPRCSRGEFYFIRSFGYDPMPVRWWWGS